MVKRFIFILILLIAAVSRFAWLSSIPPSLNWDEVSHGYNAYSVMKTGKDQWGKNWPVFNFRAYGDYPMTLNMYLSIPSIKIFGLNEFGVRFPSALLGFLTVVASYFLAKAIFDSPLSPFLLMFLTAISPWMVLPSRAVFQSTVAQFFLVSGITFFIFAAERKKPSLLILSSFLWAVSGYGYHSTRVVAPALFFATLFIYRDKVVGLLRQNKPVVILSLLIFFFVSIPQLVNLSSPESRARGKWVFLLDQGAINQINEQRRLFSGNPVLSRLIYNKATYLFSHAMANFISYFDPRKLFFKGGDHYQFSVPDMGVLPVVGLPFFYLGLAVLAKGLLKKDEKFWFLASWLVIGLFPAAITKGEFQVIRAASVLPVPQILILLGLIQTIFFLRGCSFVKGKLLIAAFLVLAFVGSINWWRCFTGLYRTHYSWAWQYGYKEAVSYAKKHYGEYDKIVFTKRYGEPHEFVLFYWPWEPSYYQQDPRLVWDYHANWYWVDAFDKFEFWNDWEVKEKLKIQNEKLKILLITSPGNWVEGGKKLKTISFLDGSPAFEIIEYK
jgi:4-amino-4-deoxy-L-arabinose transferase-like glycosyltransferase